MRALVQIVVIAIGLFSIVTAVAYQQETHSHNQAQATNSPAWAELRESMEGMHTAMASVTSSSDSDLDFVRLMLPHHEAAIEMTKTELLHGKDPQIRRLAQEIITDQQAEIQLMEMWLKQHATSGSPAGAASRK